MPTARYSAGNIEWTKEKVKETDRKTRKIITMYGGLHPRAISERLYLPRSEGGRELLSIEDCVNDGRKNLALYDLRSNEKLIIASATELKLKKFIIAPNRQERRKQRLTEWKEKSLDFQFLKEIEGTDDGHSQEWLKRSEIKRETETLMCAALEQALRVNTIKYSIDKTSDTPLCRPCNEKTESIAHIVRACSIQAKNQYRKCNDKVGAYVYQSLCKKCFLQCSDKWYTQKLQSVLENDGYKIFWDFNIQADKVIEHR